MLPVSIIIDAKIKLTILLLSSHIIWLYTVIQCGSLVHMQMSHSVYWLISAAACWTQSHWLISTSKAIIHLYLLLHCSRTSTLLQHEWGDIRGKEREWGVGCIVYHDNTQRPIQQWLYFTIQVKTNKDGTYCNNDLIATSDEGAIGMKWNDIYAAYVWF